MKPTARVLLFGTFLTIFLAMQIPVLSVSAATPTPTATSSAIADAEIQREKTIMSELALTLPATTDDPNYTITFSDPSTNKQGVDITVDDKTTSGAKSPFLLQNLSIGKHALVFKFKNKDGLVRVLSKSLIVVPKAPVLDATVKQTVTRPSQVILQGTALPQATVLIVINSMSTFSVTATQDGKWEFIVPEPTSGVSNAIFFTIRDGIVSNPSKSFAFEYKLSAEQQTNTTQQTTTDIAATFRTVIANIDENRKSQPILFYGIIATAVVLVLVMVIVNWRKKAAKKRDQKTIAALFGTVQNEGGSIVDIIQSMKKSVIEDTPKVKGKKSTAKTKKEEKVIKVSLDESKPEELPKKEDKTPEITKETTKTAKPAFNIFGLFKKKEAPKTTTPTPVNKEEKKPETPVVVPTEQPEQKPEPPIIEKLKKQEKKEKLEIAKAVKSAEPTADEVETEEPEKKVLSKEEFLKEFQKGAGQDE